MDRPALQAAWTRYKRGSYWTANGRCKGFAVQNPGEAAKLDAFVAAIVAGGTPAPPTLATATGQGLVGIIQAGMGSPPPPSLKVTITGTPKQGSALTAVTA